MRKGPVAGLLLVIVLGAAGLYLFTRPGRQPGPTEQKETETPQTEVRTSGATATRPPNETSGPASSQASTSQVANTRIPDAPNVAPLGVPGPLFYGGPESTPVKLPPETVLENMRLVFRNYASMFGGNPVGTNPEITQELNGGNGREVKFLDPDNGMRINSKGELVDNWGTPFFFHQLSATEMEIHSAGPDKRMWTDDDLVTK